MTLRFRLITAFFLLAGTTGCLPVLAGGVAAGGVAVAQERSVGTAVDDAAIQTKIWNKFLQSNTRNLYSDVGIEVTEGRVLLTGKVPTQDSAASAVQLAWDVDGVKEVINEIQVTQEGNAATFAQDSWITAQVKSRLIAEKGVKSVNYTIETVAGKVYIMGIAQNEDELSRVLNVTSRVKGVRQVVSHVRMKDDPRRMMPANPEQSATSYDTGYGGTQDSYAAPVQQQNYNYADPQPVTSEPNYQDSSYTDRYGYGDSGVQTEQSPFTPQY